MEMLDAIEAMDNPSDHLGSASWITDMKGCPIQYMHYAPYGELMENQRAVGYDERFKFTGKERDQESGYDFFGARYYSSLVDFWFSVDPLMDKYPGKTPYLYCNGNPIMMIDPDGREWFLNDESQIIWQDNPANAPRNYTYIGTSENLLAYYGLSAQYGEQDVMNFRVGTNITSK